LLDVFDRIHHDADGRVEYHYVLVDFLCVPIGGTLRRGSDAADARWVQPLDLGRFQLNAAAAAVIAKGLELAARGV
jgi:hypothetical protein